MLTHLAAPRRAHYRAALAALAVAVAALVAPAPARADGLADEADLQFQLGTDRYRAGDFTGALEHFLASNRLVPNRNVVFNIARSYEQLGRYADAHRYYVDALVGETSERVVGEIRAALGRLAPNVAVLDVESTPPGATIYINRRDLGSRGRAPRPLAFPPGSYVVIAELEGYEPAQSEPVEARAGASTQVRLALRRIVGAVRVEGPAGAAVRVDDERGPTECVAPCELSLAPGPHTLYLSREGYQVLPRAVNVLARQATRVRASLAPLTGSLVVGTDERDALVEVDGRSVGFTPVVVPNVPVGRRVVRVSLRGYTPVERVVTVRANEQTDLTDVRLVPVREVTAASRTAESIEDAPSSVSVITAQEIQAFAYPTIAEALRGTRGVLLSNDRAYVSAGIRGLGQPNDYGNRLLVLSDGQPLNDNLLYSSYIGYDGRTDLHDTERIEVVRGPGSLLYGTGALSGVVNLVTRGRDERTGVNVGLATYDNAVARARVGGAVRFGRDGGVWASFAGARSDGFDSSLLVPGAMGMPATEQPVRGVEAFLSGTAAGRVWYGPLTAQWLFTSRDQAIPVGAYGTLVGDSRTRWQDTRGMLEVRFEPRLTDRLQLLTRVHANLYDFHGAYAYEGGQLNVENYRGVWFGAEARLAWTIVPRLRVTAGGEFQWHPEARLDGRAQVEGTPGASTYLSASRPYYVGAAYAVAEWSPVSWFRFSGGARFDAFSTVEPTVNPRGALIFRPTRGGILKIMGGRAFRAPSIYEQLYNDGGMTQVPACPPMEACRLRPETIYSAEVEYSQRLFESWVALVAAHASVVQDIIDTVGAGDASSPLRYQNARSPALIAGGDVELRREFRQGWMLAATYTFLLAQYTDTAMFPRPQLVNAPQHLGSFRAVVPIVQGVANGALRVAVEGPRRINTTSDAQTEPAVVADAVVSGQIQRFGLRYAAGVYNLFDWRYATPTTESYASPTARQNGRTFMVNLQASF